MPSEHEAMQPAKAPNRQEYTETVFAIGIALADLDPGPLAELRRMLRKDGDYGAPYFWRLVSRHRLHGPKQANWAHIIQMMAILTPKGRDESKPSPHTGRSKHNGYRGFGTVLCDGGDPSWGTAQGTDRPVLSEQRLARLLAARGDMRADLLERAVRMLAVKKPPGVSIDCTDIAALLLFPDDPAPVRRVASDYYGRLDRAQQKSADDTNATSAPGDDE